MLLGSMSNTSPFLIGSGVLARALFAGSLARAISSPASPPPPSPAAQAAATVDLTNSRRDVCRIRNPHSRLQNTFPQYSELSPTYSNQSLNPTPRSTSSAHPTSLLA